MLSTALSSFIKPVSKSERLVTTFFRVPSSAKTDFHPDPPLISSNPPLISSTRTTSGVDILDNDISKFSEVHSPVKLERASLSAVPPPHDDDIPVLGALYNTPNQRKGVCGTKRTVNQFEPPVPKTVWGLKNEEPPNKKFKRYTTPTIRRREAASKKREATLQAQVEEEWAQVEENEVVAPNQVPNVKPPTPSESDSYENPNYRLFIQAEEQKKKKRICAALQSCLPPNTTDEQVMRLYNISVSCFQSFKGLDGTEFEKTVQVPPSFDKTIGLQSQVTVNNGLVDTVNNDGREDFVPYLIANGPFKHGEHVPVIISHKVSLRERWKQDEGVAQHSRVFLITLAGLKTSDVSVQKLKKARAHNIHIVVPNLSEFQDNHFVTNKRPLCLTESQMWTQIHSCLSATNLNIVKK